MTKYLLLVAAMLLSSPCNSHNDRDMSAMNRFKLLKTECVGRVLIDLPIGTASWMQSYGYGEITKLDAASLEEFRHLVSARKSTLKEAKHEKAGSMLVAYTEPTDTSAAMVLHTDPDVDIGPDLEEYLWLKKTAYKIRIRALTENSLEYASRFFPILSDFAPFPDDGGVPTAPGFCIDQALLIGRPIGEYGTRADYNVRPVKRPGLSIGLLVEENQERLGGSAFDSLKTEERSAEGRGGEVGLKQFRVLRKQNRDLDGFDGEETISLTELKNGTKLYSFRWRTLGQLKSIVHPHITITMDTDNPLRDGTYIKTPPEEEMIGLWDAVLASLRHRPAALSQGAK
jgi:hypothetical protein